MQPIDIFISYSHEDEWLKNELVKHLSALRRKNIIDAWHDRRIPPGGLLHEEIDTNVHKASIFLFLVSTDFIASDYCMEKEYKVALDRFDKGEAEIIPVIIRDCDWDVDRLRQFNALPKDGIAVTRNAGSRPDSQSRDVSWLQVIDGLKTVVGELKKKLEPPQMLASYADPLFNVEFVRHPALSRFDERLVFVEPDLYYENEKQQLSTMRALYDACKGDSPVVIFGADRSGKTVIAKRLQLEFVEDGITAVLINGRQIRNRDISRLVDSNLARQYASKRVPKSHIQVIIDDFDDCVLPDQVKEAIVKELCQEYRSCILISFSNAPTVLFASTVGKDPLSFQLNPITDSKLLTLVRKWLAIGCTPENQPTDSTVLSAFEKLQLVFSQTEVDKAPYTAINFLELINSVSATDIAYSSYAACYDALITKRLGAAGISPGGLDEAKNFLSLLAYRSYVSSGTGCLTRTEFEECMHIFEEQFLSSRKTLNMASVGVFIEEIEDGYSFIEDYIWFFLCARYVVKNLSVNDRGKYIEFVNSCASNIFQKKFANIVIYIAYFSNDNVVIESLLTTLDGLFSRANGWLLSDDSRELVIGLVTHDSLMLQSRSDVGESRVALLEEKIHDILTDAERVVARYTLPFLNPNIADSTYVEGIDSDSVDSDSYMKSVNALLRIHSVIGQILNGRSGTFNAALILDCIGRMVQASGRYVSLNHAIATVLIYDKEKNIEDVAKLIKNDKLTAAETFEKVTRIFAFWSVYLSHAGLARYLSQEHSIRALEKLSEQYESGNVKTDDGNIPFNFALVLVVARLYQSGRIDRSEIDGLIRKYGDTSSLMSVLRVVMHIYAYYMPLSIEDKQWIANRFHMPLSRIELQNQKAGISRVRRLADMSKSKGQGSEQ